MVARLICLLAFLAFFNPLFLWAQDVKVTAEVDPNNAMVENAPLTTTIMITHPNTLKVDPNSFILEKSPLKVEFVRDVRISPASNLLISIYQFVLKGQPKGLHILPPIRVKVGGKQYESIASTYEILDKKTPSASSPNLPPTLPSRPLPTTPSPPVQPALQLEALVDGPNPMYPGQRAKLVYRYLFSGSIELSKEYLPMLEPKGLRKIGDTEISDYTRGNLSVHEISQEVEAVDPGAFSFGPSYAEGLAYSKTKLHVEAPAITVTVKPLPTDGRPASFNGAIGNFTFKASLMGSGEVNVGDKFSLAIDISGKGVLENVPLPDLCCQPGFSGRFRSNDLPPAGEIQGTVKHFTVELRPLSEDIKEVPSIEFSYFNPEIQKYVILQSSPIPIKVNPIKTQIPDGNIPAAKSQPGENVPSNINKPALIEIEGNYVLDQASLHNQLFASWLDLLIIPLAIILLFVQIQLRRDFLKRKLQLKKEHSSEIFAQAMQTPSNSPLFFHLLNKAFLLRLVEKGELDSIDLAPENLSTQGAAGLVRAFLLNLEEIRFSGKGRIDQSLLKEAENLFHKLSLK